MNNQDVSLVMGPRDDRKAIEHDPVLALKFNDDGLVPVVTTDAATGQVLMQAWMNLEAVQKTIESGEAHYWSRSRRELWHKGATSGQIQTVTDFRVDCDQDSLWLVVEQAGGGCCHVGYESCFYRTIPTSRTVTGTVALSDAGVPRNGS